MKDGKITISDRLLDLLAEEATFGLGSSASGRPPDIPTSFEAEHEAMMLAATLDQLGFLKLDEVAYREMPAHLRRRILEEADQYLDDQ